jgi:thiamine biosynthesis lipoprotein
MGSDAHVIVVGGPAALTDMAATRIAELERRWSRFVAESEVSRLNQVAGRPVEVSADTALLVECSIDAWKLTAGRFDPTVHHAVEQAGYDQSFELLHRKADQDVPNYAVPNYDVPNHGRPTAGRRPARGCAGIDVQGLTVTLPVGVGFDPGGIGKGLAADLVVMELLAAGASGACVNLGGDLRIAGEGPGGGAWTVAIEHPGSDRPVALLGMTSGAVATSTTLRRRWLHDGFERHHLIDPFTGEPSDTDVTLASVVTGLGWQAEVLAKAVLLRGSTRAFDVIDECRAQAMTVDRCRVVRATAGLHAYLGGMELPDLVPPITLEEVR